MVSAPKSVWGIRVETGEGHGGPIGPVLALPTPRTALMPTLLTIVGLCYPPRSQALLLWPDQATCSFWNSWLPTSARKVHFFTSVPLENVCFKVLLTLIHLIIQQVFLRAHYAPDTVMGTRDITGKP